MQSASSPERGPVYSHAHCIYSHSTEFEPVKLHLKIDLVSHPARAERLGKYDIVTPHDREEVWDIPLQQFSYSSFHFVVQLFLTTLS